MLDSPHRSYSSLLLFKESKLYTYTYRFYIYKTEFKKFQESLIVLPLFIESVHSGGAFVKSIFILKVWSALNSDWALILTVFNWILKNLLGQIPEPHWDTCSSVDIFSHVIFPFISENFLCLTKEPPPLSLSQCFSVKSLTVLSNLKISSKLTYVFSSYTSNHLVIYYLQTKILFWSSGREKVFALWTKPFLMSSVKKLADFRFCVLKLGWEVFFPVYFQFLVDC